MEQVRGHVLGEGASEEEIAFRWHQEPSSTCDGHPCVEKRLAALVSPPPCPVQSTVPKSRGLSAAEVYPER